jgi:hypothetical protein
MTDCKCFFTIDLLKGYWQLLQDLESSNVYTIVTPFGKYSSTRVVQGAVNAPAHFQAEMTNLLRDLIAAREALSNWVDDLLGGGRGERLIDAQRDLLRLFCAICELLDSVHLRASAEKLVLYADRVQWFGLILSKDGISHTDDRISVRDAPE